MREMTTIIATAKPAVMRITIRRRSVACPGAAAFAAVTADPQYGQNSA
jgi:hypothetical protein